MYKRNNFPHYKAYIAKYSMEILRVESSTCLKYLFIFYTIANFSVVRISQALKVKNCVCYQPLKVKDFAQNVIAPDFVVSGGCSGRWCRYG